MQSVEPEREMARRALPFAAGAVILCFALGTAARDLGVGASVAIGAVVAFANFAAAGSILVWASRISVTFLGVAAFFGVVARLAVIAGIVVLLDRLAFFSPGAFFLGVLALIFALLVFEVKMLMGPMGREVRLPERDATS